MPQHQDPTFLTFEQIDAILAQSVDEILRHEDPQQYFAWMRAKASEFFGHLPFIDKSGPAAIAAAAARSIWNATPLPGHQFRPRPLPPPERNALCPCGSGIKHKHCCAGLPDLDMGHTEDLWPWVIRHLTPATLNAALEHRRIPGWALAAVARMHLEQGHNSRAAELLEPLFGGDLARLDGRFEEALDVLCDAYLELGYEHQRMALLERVAGKGGKELARAAHERMASMLFDRGERDAAWESFRRAQRADPDNPSLVLNEVTLLVAEHRFEEASARARFWVAKLRKSGLDYDGLIDALEEMARDPARAVADSYLDGQGLDAARLRKWIESLRQRPLPDYTLSEPEPIDLSSPERAREHLGREVAQMGIPPEEQEAAVRLLMADLKRMERRARREAKRVDAGCGRARIRRRNSGARPVQHARLAGARERATARGAVARACCLPRNPTRTTSRLWTPIPWGRRRGSSGWIFWRPTRRPVTASISSATLPLPCPRKRRACPTRCTAP